MSRQATNTLWRLLEIYHSVVYFAPERPKHYQELGLKGGWMGYFATRSAAMGVVPATVVTACFYNFRHSMVARALPDAWLYTTPEKATQARLTVFDEAIRRLLDGQLTTPELTQTARAAIAAVGECTYPARPLFAAHSSLPVPDDPHLALFWAASALREFRGDGHVATLAAAQVDGCEAHVLMTALGLVPAEQRQLRGWTDDDWAAAEARLIERGWIAGDGSITSEGRRSRADIERTTEDLAEAPWTRLGEEVTTVLIEHLTPVASRIVTGGGVPYPNAVGAPPVPELSASR